MTRKFFLSCLFLLVSVALCNAKEIDVKTLANGFKVISYKDNRAPLIAMQLWITHGSTSESDKEAGIAHFLEHLTFRSKDIAKQIEDVGGDINAYTSLDRTVYHLVIPKEHWQTGLSALEDILFKTKFDEKSFNAEKEVILEEMKRTYDNPQRVLYNLFFSTALKVHPARRPVIGYEETIKGATIEDVKGFYERYYSPSSAFLVLVGDLNDEIQNKVEAQFGQREAKNIPPLAPIKEDEREKPAFSVKGLAINSCYLMLGIPTTNVTDPASPLLDILSFYYGESATSLLKERLKEEKQLVNYIYSYQMSTKDLGFFVVQANFNCENTKAVIEELEHLLFKSPLAITENDLKKTTISYESNFYFSRERFSDIASDLGSSYFYYGNPAYSETYIDAIRQAKLSDVKKIKDQYFKLSKVTFALVTPHDFTSKAEEILKNSLSLPAPKEPLTIKRLKNGVTLIVRKTEDVPTFGFTILSLSGSRLEDKDSAGLSNFTISSLLRGTKTFSYKELSEKIETLGGSISGFSTKNLSGIKGKFLSRSFYDAMKLIEDLLLNFSPPERELEKVKRLILADIKKKRENPTRILKDLLFETVYPESPLGLPIEGYEGTVSSFTQREVIEHFKKIFHNENLVVAFSGDLPEDALSIITQSLEKLKTKSQKGTTSLSPNPKKKSATLQEMYNQSHIIVSFPVPGIKAEERDYFHLLSQILSNQSGRLFTKLRDEEGLAYALGAFLYESPEGSLFNLYIGTSPEKVEKAKNGLIDELERTLTTPITSEEKEKALNQIVMDITQSLQDNLDASYLYATNQLFFGNPLYYKDYLDRLRKIEASQLSGKVREYLERERAVTVIVMGRH